MTNDVVQGPMEGFTAFELRKARAEIERLEGIQRDFHNLDDLATIQQLHAAVKTAQELAATRLMEIERLLAFKTEAAALLDPRRQMFDREWRKRRDALLEGGATPEPLPSTEHPDQCSNYPDCSICGPSLKSGVSGETP